MANISPEQIELFRNTIAELFKLAGQVSIDEGDVTFWANAVRNNAKSLDDALSFLQKQLLKDKDKE